MTRRRALVTVGVWLLLCLSLVVSNARPAVLVLGGIVAVTSAAILVVSDFAKGVTRVEWTRRLQVRTSTRGNDPRVSSLRNQLFDARWFRSAELRETLVALVDDRLLAHHHIDRASDPDSAMEALTPLLRQLVANPRRPAAAARQLNRIIADIESL